MPIPTKPANVASLLAAMQAQLEALARENEALKAGSGRSPTFEQSTNNPKYWVFKTGGKGYPTSGTAAQWRAILANAKLIEASLPAED
jgi:hypothetical protein